MEPKRVALKEVLPRNLRCILICLFSACAAMLSFGCGNGAALAQRVAVSDPGTNGNRRSSFISNPAFRGGDRHQAAGVSRRRANRIVEGRRLGPVTAMGMARKHLRSGPGSRPPRCGSKCGNCTPCTPVHVPVPPGTPVTTEYYPETWRCKCGDKLYVP